MLIVDKIYKEKLNAGTFLVPPFHTGHLGLIPGTHAKAVLLNQSEDIELGCEICVTPYDRDTRNLFTIECTLMDKPGAVCSFLEAVASMGVNVVSLESASIDSMSKHSISLLLDWSTSPTKTQKATPTNVQNIFFPLLGSTIPINDFRYLILLQRVILFCESYLVWGETDAKGFSIPSIRILPISESRFWQKQADTKICSPQKKSLLQNSGVEITIGPQVSEFVERHTGYQDDEEKTYLLTSQTDNKTLRIFVPSKDYRKKIVHLAFSHFDYPGALHCIAKIVADAGFNILSSLVRAKEDNRNLWELIIQTDFDLPSSYEKAATLVYKKVLIQAKNNNVKTILRNNEVELSPPMYPPHLHFKPKPMYENTVTKNLKSSIVRNAEEFRADRVAELEISRGIEPIRWLTFNLLDEDLTGHSKPRVFLSYPKTASSLAKYVKEKLDQSFEVHELQDAAHLEITKEARNRIRHCHYFIGLWHPDNPNDVNDLSMSPWLLFEYGVATEANKPAHVLVHDRLKKSVMGRIKGDFAVGVYNETDFTKEPLSNLVDGCKREWLNQEG